MLTRLTRNQGVGSIRRLPVHLHNLHEVSKVE